MYDVNATLVERMGDRAIQRQQYIPDSFLTALAEARAESLTAPAGDMHRVAAIPVVFVEKWMREGFNVYTAPVRETVAKLKAEGLDAFVATEKRV